MFGSNYRLSDEENEPTWLRRAYVTLEFCAVPRRCHATGRLLWLRRAVKTTRIYTGPGEPVEESRWYDQHEFLMIQLKGKR
jgi:hypothetical protein